MDKLRALTSGDQIAELSSVGKSFPRIDGLEKVTGQAAYCGDLRLPGMLCAKVLRSPHPHARIVEVEASKARALPGVRGVVTGRDAPKARMGRMLFDEPVLAQEVVRYVGEPVAAVAATSEEVAEEALELIAVEYEQLPAVFDAEEALQPEPPVIIHPNLMDYVKASHPPRLDPALPNVHNHLEIRDGDVAAGFAQSDLVIENRFSLARQHHCQLEPHVCVARPDAGGGLTVWSSTQALHPVKLELCRLFGLSASQLRVIAPYTGGGFGGKISLRTEPIAILLALKTGRPVKLSLSRKEVFSATNTRAPIVVYVKDGFKRDGTLLAREMKVIVNGGAYSDIVSALTERCTLGAVGTYRMPNFKLDSYGVYTNEPVAGPFRGFGVPALVFAIEGQMDMAGEKLGISPLEIRKKNILREGDVSVIGEVTHSTGAEECLERVAQLMGEAQRESQGPVRRAWGISLGSKFSPAPASSCASVKVYPDGVVEVHHSACEMGQGSDTVLSQIAAEEFGVPLGRVRLVARDTAVTPFDGITAASRTTYMTGNAVRAACLDAKRQLIGLASRKMELPAEELKVEGGKVYMKGQPQVAIGISQLFSPDGFVPGRADVVGSSVYTSTPTLKVPPLKKDDRLHTAFYTHGAQAAEVEVNVETGEARVLKLISAFDVGQPVNPKLCEAQIEGGVGMGIGTSIYEEMVMDEGTVVNPSFLDYRLPTAKEIPSGDNVRTEIVSALCREGPYGAKGLGEAALTPTAPAIASAVYNAVGVRIKELPISNERLLKAIRERDKTE